LDVTVDRQLVGPSARVELNITAVSARVIGVPTRQHDRDGGPRGRFHPGRAGGVRALVHGTISAI
jgi:hypothetical protein